MNKRVFTRALGDPEPLLELLVARTDLDRLQAQALLAVGGVYVGHERAVAPRPVAVGDKITIYMDGPGTDPAQALPVRLVHRDQWIAVVDKPAGMPSQAERSQHARSLDAWAQHALGGAARLMHRLDKEASGLVLFATQASAYAPVQAALAAGAIERRYLAIVDGELRGDGTIALRIGRHARDRRLRAALPEHAPAGESARSRYRALATGAWLGRAVSAVELQLETGRPHQLRVHLAGIGHPIVGDVAYGGSAFARVCLHAYSLALPHPRDGRRLGVDAPLPPQFAALVPGLTSPVT